MSITALITRLSGGMINEVTLHPILVHFPIVLLFVFMTFYFLNMFCSNFISRWINFGLLCATLGFAFLAKYAGENAGIIVGPTLINPRALVEHAGHAINFLWTVGILLLIFIFVEFFILKEDKPNKIVALGLKSLVLICGFISMFWLVQTGHTGATLVFKYAAGVDIPIQRAQKVIQEKSSVQ